jgi:hypothetical protein
VIEGLRGRVAGQTISQDDIKAMQRDKARMDGEQRAATAAREEAERQEDGNQAAVGAKTEELEAVASEYTAKGEALQVLPPGAKRSNGVDFTLVLNYGRSEVCATNLKGAVLPALADIAEEYAERTRDDQRELLELQEQQHKSNEALAVARESNTQGRTSLHALESQYKTEKERADAEFAQQTSNAASVEEGLRDGEGARGRRVRPTDGVRGGARGAQLATAQRAGLAHEPQGLPAGHAAEGDGQHRCHRRRGHRHGRAGGGHTRALRHRLDAHQLTRSLDGVSLRNERFRSVVARARAHTV